MPSRSDVRKRLRDARRALSPEQRVAHAEALAWHLARQPLFLTSRRIAAYLPVDSEMDPMPLVWRAWELGKTVYLPVLVPYGHNRLWFAPFREGDPLVRNRFGIAEPLRIHRERANAIELDLVLAPLVGFDARGNRLGMGGGFYDRSFAFLNRRQCWKKPRLIGLAHECQQVPRLDGASWDVPLHAIATEEGLRIIGQKIKTPLRGTA
ncbi:MAG: 5-formyltetrahydrofolate cyclo-ligase [Gammaproteobacteria bacterium]|nr:5-formyltetrahydrofolate cyclo-ligase [Gammaproteobacteria bacterium]